MLQRTAVRIDDRQLALTQLGEQLEKAWAHQRQVNDEDAYERVAAIVRKIETSSARSLEEMRVKARAIAWCHAGEGRISLASKPTTDLRLAQSIIEDLLSWH